MSAPTRIQQSTSRQARREALLRALRDVELFQSLSPEHLEKIADAGAIEELSRGDHLFRSGDPPDRIHLLLDGALEITRITPDHDEAVPVAYISPGEIIGDMAIFTGSRRRSNGRVPERALVWTLARTEFERLSERIPGYAFELTRMFAGRLEAFISHMRRQSRRKELAGQLKHFDLPTVVQTLVSSRQSGILTILDESGETSAEVLLRDGAIERTRCGEIEGEEGFYEIFLGGDEGEFAFRTAAELDPDAVSAVPIELSAMKLLIEAMRLMDELRVLQERLPPAHTKLAARAQELTWEEARTEPLARTILAQLRTPATIAELAEAIEAPGHVLHQVLVQLLETNQIG